jgi:hypothetical protein
VPQNADGCELDDGKEVDREFVIAGCSAPTLLNFVEESLDQVPRPIDARA